MSRLQQRRALRDLAGTLRKIAADIEAIGAPGRLGLRRPDKEVAAGSLIGAGVTLFDTAAALLRSGKPNDSDLAAAEVLEKTGNSYRERVLAGA